MITATYPKSKYFTQYTYTTDTDKRGNGLDVYLTGQCTSKSDEGFVCISCYERELDRMISRYFGYQPLKRFLAYQLGLYENSETWLREFSLWAKHSNKVNAIEAEMISDVLEDIIEVEEKQADIKSFVNITNDFSGSTIHQVNNGGVNSLEVNYISTLDSLHSLGVPSEIIEEGKEVLKDALAQPNFLDAA